MEGEYMENSSISKILGIVNVILKMTCGKFLNLNNMLQVANIRKKLVVWLIIEKNGYKIVFESDKFILIKSRIFVENRYFCDEIFKINKCYF